MRVNGVPTSKPTRAFSCKQVVERTTEFMEGRLPATAQGRWVRHVQSCASCSTYAQQIALVRAALPRLPGAQMATSARRKLLKRLAERTSGE